MAYWLMKSEPDVFSFTDLMNKPVEEWHGVRNFTARNNMKAMKLGDLSFFYHSNIGKEIVNRQRDFMEKGTAYLKPLTMVQVAEVVGVHETTVSRACSLAKKVRVGGQ